MAEKLEVKQDDNLLKSIPLDVTFEDIHGLWKWKEIKNCPGRYVLKKKVGNNLSSMGFMTQSLKKLHEMNVNENDKEEIKINQQHLVELKETFGLKQDKIYLMFFKDKGGVMTYEKTMDVDMNQDEHKSNDEINQNMVYIHTLNDSSGMLRKLRSMNVDHKYDQESGYFMVKEHVNYNLLLR